MSTLPVATRWHQKYSTVKVGDRRLVTEWSNRRVFATKTEADTVLSAHALTLPPAPGELRTLIG